jgi:tetratricopeptide (TPR) repeat protein
VRALFLSLFATLVALASAARAQDSAHERAVAEYQSGSYEEARVAWLEALAESGPEARDRAALLYNLGNAAYRLGRPLEAAGWYTAAIELAPRHEAAWRNLEFVRRRAGVEPADRGDLSSTVVRLTTVLTRAECERVVLALLAALALVLGFEAWRGGVAAKVLAGVLAGLVCIASVPWAMHLARAGERQVFVVQPEGAPLSSEPREASAVVGRLAPASRAQVIDALPGWVRVRQGGASGWIAAPTCVPLQPPYGADL